MDPVIAPHIEKKLGVCGGKACVASTRIRVQDVYVWHELRGRSPDEIVSEFPQLTLADIHAALAYYWDNLREIRDEMEQAEALLRQVKQVSSSPLQEKLRGGEATGTQVPSR